MTNLKWIISNRILSMFRQYEPEVGSCLRNISGMTFWDIGANIGYYTFKLRRQFNTICAVEPDYSSQKTIAKRAKLLRVDNIVVLPYALSNRNGEIKMWVRPFRDIKFKTNRYSGSSMFEDFQCLKNTDSVTVQCRTFDYLADNEYIELVKIDVEAAELLVLEGMSNSLKHHRIKHIVIECHLAEYKSKIEEIFTQNNYRFKWIDNYPISHILGVSE